jgi:hypothetical protein
MRKKSLSFGGPTRFSIPADILSQNAFSPDPPHFSLEFAWSPGLPSCRKLPKLLKVFDDEAGAW